MGTKPSKKANIQLTPMLDSQCELFLDTYLSELSHKDQRDFLFHGYIATKLKKSRTKGPLASIVRVYLHLFSQTLDAPDPIRRTWFHSDANKRNHPFNMGEQKCGEAHKLYSVSGGKRVLQLAEAVMQCRHSVDGLQTTLSTLLNLSDKAGSKQLDTTFAEPALLEKKHFPADIKKLVNLVTAKASKVGKDIEKQVKEDGKLTPTQTTKNFLERVGQAKATVAAFRLSEYNFVRLGTREWTRNIRLLSIPPPTLKELHQLIVTIRQKPKLTYGFGPELIARLLELDPQNIYRWQH